MMKTYKILLSFFLILISGMGFSQSVPSYVTTNGLVGWWGFNGNAQDNSGNGNHGTVIGATLTSDRFGNQNAAYSFNGVSNWIEVQDHLSLRPANITLATWVFLTVNPSSYSLITKTNLQTAHGEQYTLGVFNQNIESLFSIKSISGCSPGTGWRTVLAQSGFLLNQWNFLVATYDGFALKIYRNGLLSPFQTNIADGIDNCPSGTLNFGRYWNGQPDFFNGKLDDIGIWNRALTQQEITNLYNSQSGITIPTINSCLSDTTSVTISHPTLTGVANASLRMTYNPDSLTYVGFNSLNPAFNGMTISGGNGSVLMDWNTSTNQTIAAGNMVNLRFRVNGNSNINWDTTTIPCEFSDVNFDVIPQTYVSGSITQNTQRLTWNRSICEGQSFALGNQSYTTSGTYQGRNFGTGGACDTLITMNLNVIPTQTILPAVTTCSNQPFSFNGLSLSTSGTYFDTLINSLGCDSILQLNLTVNPAYNQNQSVVICPGTTYSFGGQNLSSSGTYSHTYTTANGCDSLVQLNLSVADSVSIQSSNGSNGFCPGGSLRIGLVNPILNVSYQWTKDGSIMTGANSDSLMVTQSGVYRLTVQVSPTCSVISNSINISVLNCNRITGDLKYDNNNQTPLAGVPVHLKTLLGNMVASDTTDATGGYEMSGYNNGNYVLDANVNYAWGGVNSTDALQVTRFFTSLITLSPLRIRVGDVNGSGITNSGDALLINRRITGLIPSFLVGNFVNNLPSVSASGNPIAANLRVLSTGDVNGTYNPLPLAPALVLDTVYGNGSVGTAVVRFTTAGSGVFERGIVWSSSPNPTLTSNKSIAGTGGFGFTHSFSSIDPNNIQYARAYARTSAGVYYSPERSFTPIPGLRCPGTPTVTDIDGNVYNTVQIGTQCWTQSNLKTSKYRNGDNIPTGLNGNQWGNTSSGAYSIYDDLSSNNDFFGKIYNNFAVSDFRGLCPTGWRVPNSGDWIVLNNFVGNINGPLRSTITAPNNSGWILPNSGATNSTGFSAIPGGYRGIYGGYDRKGLEAAFWTTSYMIHPPYQSALYILIHAFPSVFNDTPVDPHFGCSIRCLKNTLPQVNTTSVTNVTPSTALVTGEVISEGDQNTTRGFCYSITSNPTISYDTTMNGIGLGVYTGTLMNLTPLTTYYVRAYATNSVGTSYGNEVSFITSAIPSFTCGTSTVSDVDNNTYNTVQIGNQCWTQSNLKVSKYRNGDNIPSAANNPAWGSSNIGMLAVYEGFSPGFYDTYYGKLYNWFALNDSRGICPIGWRVPSKSDWNSLFGYLDPISDTNYLSSSTISLYAGGMMKSTGNLLTSNFGWYSPNTGATNSSGFSALAGGYRVGGWITPSFNDFGFSGAWWSTATDSNNWGFSYKLYYHSSHLFMEVQPLQFGASVRCLKD